MASLLDPPRLCRGRDVSVLVVEGEQVVEGDEFLLNVLDLHSKTRVEVLDVEVAELVRPFVVVALGVADGWMAASRVCLGTEFHQNWRTRPFLGVVVQDGESVALVVCHHRKVDVGVILIP